jgi:hypothetical protein
MIDEVAHGIKGHVPIRIARRSDMRRGRGAKRVDPERR